ncbi:hypothetical protein NIIDMKKI_78600 [Mycobacterium kansasii]|uniref:Arabinosyltransferase C-terminal domain-containing protein n=1 Tax=Mycobacterium kansasii TaxID=1768 RepID=A0A7G1IQK0_MYCKA|nr:hypothetical protein NIIDMKKI_78600 [Mycobacterium kansasii]
MQWATDDQAASGRPGGSMSFADVGAVPAWRNLRAPLSAIPDSATQIRLVADDEDLAPQHWIALTPPRIPRLRTLQDVVGSRIRCSWTGWSGWHSRASDRSAIKTALSRHRHGGSCRTGSAPRPILPSWTRTAAAPGHHRVAAARDDGGQLSQGRLVPGLGLAAAADPYYPDAEPARLQLGTVTRSGLWNPAPMRKG